MATTFEKPTGRPFAELAEAVFGEPLSMGQAWERMDEIVVTRDQAAAPEASLWIGSVGYERHKHSENFARLLRDAGVERVVDVRELPISRRRGYAKTALGQAVSEVGVEYIHVKALGNPKPFRDLYKSGHADEGRRLYEEFLLRERHEALEELSLMLASKRTALMCVEHDPSVCHRTVIIDALRDELGLDLTVAEIG